MQCRPVDNTDNKTVVTVKNDETKKKKKVAEVEDPSEHLATSPTIVLLDVEVEEEERSDASSHVPKAL